MDKSALAMTGFKPLSKHFSRQKRSAHFGEKREKGVIVRNSVFGLTVSKASGRQYCMQSIPLAVLKHYGAVFADVVNDYCMQSIPLAVLKLRTLKAAQAKDELHAIHTACGIETLATVDEWASWRELHAIHTACGIETWQRGAATHPRGIACNPYRLRY